MTQCNSNGVFYDRNKNETLSSYRVSQYDPETPNRHTKYYFRQGGPAPECVLSPPCNSNGVFYDRNKNETLSSYRVSQYDPETPNRHTKYYFRQGGPAPECVLSPPDGVTQCNSNGVFYDRNKNETLSSYRVSQYDPETPNRHTKYYFRQGGPAPECVLSPPDGVTQCNSNGVFYDRNKNETLSSYRVSQYDPETPNRHTKYYFRQGGKAPECSNVAERFTNYKGYAFVN